MVNEDDDEAIVPTKKKKIETATKVKTPVKDDNGFLLGGMR